MGSRISKRQEIGQDVALVTPPLQTFHETPFSRAHVLQSGVAFSSVWV